MFSNNGIRQVLQEYGWPGYSIVIALADQVLPTGLPGTAYILNTASYILLTIAFIRLCMALHDGPLIPFFAALTVLCFPLINEMRFMLIRDFAFWGFAILSLQQLVVFTRTGYIMNACSWCAALFAAIFFRLEGMLLLLAPLCFLTPGQYRKSLTLGATVLAGMTISGLIAILMQINLVDLIRFAYRYYLPLIFDLGSLLEASSHETLAALFAPGNFPDTDNTGHGMVIVVFAYLWTVTANLVNALGVPVAAFIAWGLIRTGWQAAPDARRPLLFYLVLSVLTLLLFLMIMHFLTQRYATLLCLLLLTQIPPSLQQLSTQAFAGGKPVKFMATTGAIIFYLLADSLVSFGYSTAYINESIAWMNDNIPPASGFHSNNFAIAYGSGLIEEYDRISRDPAFALQNLAAGDYIALDLHYDQQQWSEELAGDPRFELVTSFGNSRDDRVMIYRYR
jgi:hypothetical protein